MKKSAYFINVGRGMTPRLDDLVAALRAKEIAGAAIDVFEQEPLREDHPLWTLPGVLLTPHTGWHGPYLDQRRFEVVLANCRALVAGEAFINLVDKSAWLSNADCSSRICARKPNQVANGFYHTFDCGATGRSTPPPARRF